MPLDLAALAQALLLFAQMTAVAGDERQVDATLFTALIRVHAEESIQEQLKLTLDDAKAATITKIEMKEGDHKQHWVAVISLSAVGNKPNIPAVIVADLNSYSERLRPESKLSDNYPNPPDTIVTNPREKGKPDTPLTLYRLLQCVNVVDIKATSFRCFFYVYRIIRFANGESDCLKCITETKDPMKESMALVNTDKAFTKAKKEALIAKMKEWQS